MGVSREIQASVAALTTQCVCANRLVYDVINKRYININFDSIFDKAMETVTDEDVTVSKIGKALRLPQTSVSLRDIYCFY